MTREEIKNTPKLVDFMLDKCVLADSRAKVHKRLEEVCDIAIKALEQQDIFDKTRAEIEQAADKQFQIAMGIADLNERYTHIQMENAYRHILNIIDKYKAESEVEE